MQLSLFSPNVRAELRRTEHGGALRRGRRKLERPVSTRRPMHVVLHSGRAGGAWSLYKHQRRIREALRACGARSGVRVYDFANVGRISICSCGRDGAMLSRDFCGRSRESWLESQLGREGASPFGAGRFWSALAWSRVVAWGRDYQGVLHYVFRNRIEATDGPAIRHTLEHGPAP